jgi:hypothetical protein
MAIESNRNSAETGDSRSQLGDRDQDFGTVHGTGHSIAHTYRLSIWPSAV